MSTHGPIAILDASPTIARGFSARVTELIPGTNDHDGRVGKFADSETKIEIKKHIRGHDAYIFQSHMPPVGERIYELLHMTNACKNGKSERITAVLPYCFGQRGERPTRARESVAAAVVAKALKAEGVDKALFCGLHAEVIQTIFDVRGIEPEHLEFEPLAANYFLNVAKREGYKHVVFGSPDVGGAKRARNLRKIAMLQKDFDLQSRIAIADKYRYEDDQVTVEELVGDVKKKPVMLYDDIGDTLGTIKGAVDLYAKHGAGPIHVLLIHPVFGNGFESRLEALAAHPSVAEIVFSNSIPIHPLALSLDKVKYVPLEPFFAEAIK